MTTPDQTAQQAREIAERVMYELLGHKWVWPALTVTEVVTVHAGIDTVSVQGRPITDVDYVRRADGDTYLAHVLESSSRIRLLEGAPQATAAIDRRPWSCAAPTLVEVRYTYGSPPPAPVAKAIDDLAREMEKALKGDRACKLPERVTSITREGMTMALIDPQDFLDKGRTGLPQVDMVLSAHNPGGTRRRAKVVGRATPLGVRVAPSTTT